MIGEIFSEDPWLWPLLWQSTLCLAVGLAASVLLGRRPAKAHQLLLTGLLAAMLMPGAYLLVRHMDLGLLVSAPPPAPRQAVEAPALMDTYDDSLIPAVSEQAVPPTLSAPPTMPAIPWRTLVLLGWLAASTIPLARLGLRFALGARLARMATSTDSVRLRHALETAKARLGISGVVRIRESARVRSPIIWCWARVPVLLVQSDAADSDADTDWVGVFCHELAHWKRLDHVSGLVTELLACALPWHPLVWWARRRLLRLSEQACDDWVLAGGQPGVDYAESLLGLSVERRMAFVPTIVGKEKAMKARIRRIITDRCGDPRVGRRWAVAVSLLAVLATVSVAFAQRRPFDDRREVGEARERREPQERIMARQREALQRMLDELAGRIREKETLLRERGDELGEERPVIELEADLLREQAEQIERRLRNFEREREEQRAARPRAESPGPALPPEESEARFDEMNRHRDELGEEAGRIERQMGQLRDGQDEEARELQAQMRRVREQMGNVESEMANLQRARAEMARAGAMEEAERARAESNQVREVSERIQDPSRRRRELQVRMREVQRELEQHPDRDNDEARALRRELDGIQEQIAGTEQELNQVQRGRPALDQGRQDVERRRREETAVQRDELMARRRELGEQVRRTEREIQELQEQGRGNTDESRERRMVLDRLLAEMQSIEERARSRSEGPARPRLERRADAEARDRIITRVFKLKYAHPEQMAAILDPLASPVGKVIPDERTGSLIVSDTPEGQEQLERIIMELDVPGPDGGRAGPETGRALENEVEELRGQVRGLHDQMQQMREMLQQLVERGQNEEPRDMR